VTDLPDRHMV